jgi:undecaprenyl-diphosphatase
VTIALLGSLIKLAVHRPRPAPDLVHVIQQLQDASFPSGHVLFYTVFFGFLIFLAYTLLKPSWLRTGLCGVLGALVALVGLSRIYVGDHWASDVAGAYLLGSLWLVLTIAVYRWGKPRFFVRQPLAPEKSGGAPAVRPPEREQHSEPKSTAPSR